MKERSTITYHLETFRGSTSPFRRQQRIELDNVPIRCQLFPVNGPLSSRLQTSKRRRSVDSVPVNRRPYFVQAEPSPLLPVIRETPAEAGTGPHDETPPLPGANAGVDSSAPQHALQNAVLCGEIQEQQSMHEVIDRDMPAPRVSQDSPPFPTSDLSHNLPLSAPIPPASVSGSGAEHASTSMTIIATGCQNTAVREATPSAGPQCHPVQTRQTGSAFADSRIVLQKKEHKIRDQEAFLRYFKFSSDTVLSKPLACSGLFAGDLFVHDWPGGVQVWIWDVAEGWRAVEAGHPHPTLISHRLQISDKKEPSWVTKKTQVTYRTRKGLI
ncbi:hypothetical protein NLJ89_g4177 [Agrocybe chaxingu]|uniref:Uncharacterized protein n=1 Tax=Agrocybe chaxingu TaxID=84603 RepID=A0A9W8MY52_9AGAR|nr:hypothetical protein NLJ89_g4177 [Agrocybe chaxingu]